MSDLLCDADELLVVSRVPRVLQHVVDFLVVLFQLAYSVPRVGFEYQGRLLGENLNLLRVSDAVVVHVRSVHGLNQLSALPNTGAKFAQGMVAALELLTTFMLELAGFAVPIQER